MGLAVFPPVTTCWVERGEIGQGPIIGSCHYLMLPGLYGCRYCPLVALVWIGVMRYGVLYMHTPILIPGRGRIG